MNLEERTIGYILTGPYDPSSPPPILDRLGKFLETPQDVNIYKGATPNDLLHPPSNNPVEALIKNNPFLSTKAFNAAYRLLRNAIDQRHYNVVLALEPVIAAPQYANLLGKDATPSLLDFEFYLQLAGRFGIKEKIQAAITRYLSELALTQEFPQATDFIDRRERPSYTELVRGDWHNIRVLREISPEDLQLYAANHPSTVYQ